MTATGIPEKLLSAMTCVRQANDQSHDAVDWIRKSIQRVQLALLSQELPKLTAHFYGKYFGAILPRSLYVLMTLRALFVSGSKLSWRFSRELFKNAIELRQRLETHGERNFADPKI